MYNTAGFNKLYAKMFAGSQEIIDDSDLKEIVWVVFSDLTNSMAPDNAEFVRRLDYFSSHRDENLAYFKVVSALFTVPILHIKLLRDGEWKNVVCSMNISGEKCLVYPVYSCREEAEPDMSDDSRMDETEIFSVIGFLEASEGEVAGIILDVHGACIAITEKGLNDLSMQFAVIFGMVSDLMEEGIEADCIFPMLLERFDDRIVKCRLKDGTIVSGRVDKVVFDDFGDASGILVITDDDVINVGIDDIDFIKARPMHLGDGPNSADTAYDPDDPDDPDPYDTNDLCDTDDSDAPDVSVVPDAPDGAETNADAAAGTDDSTDNEEGIKAKSEAGTYTNTDDDTDNDTAADDEAGTCNATETYSGNGNNGLNDRTKVKDNGIIINYADEDPTEKQ